MKRIFEESEIDALPRASADFDAIVPAAGKGSRLGADVPKVLYPILGRPILHWLSELLLAQCRRVILVVSPVGQPLIQSAIDELGISARVKLAVQDAPRGMADAVLCAEAQATSRHAVVVWGDQVTLRGATLERMVKLHASRPEPKLTVATIRRHDPYIHFERDGDQRIVRVHEARKVTMPVTVGENDCGLFAFETAMLFREIRRAAAESSGDVELDLLPLFPRFEVGDEAVATLRLSDPRETLGVNTREDAARAGEYLTSWRRESGSAP